MKKTLMILTMGLFLGTIGLTSTAMANGIQSAEIADCEDKKNCKKEDCCKKKAEATSQEGKAEAKKSCGSKEAKKACCSKEKKAEK